MLSEEAVFDAVRLTFEEMAFLDVSSGTPAQPVAVQQEGPILYLEYSRPKGGALALFLPKEVKFQVAEAIYGEDWALLSPLQLDDSLLELLNVLAGRLLTARFGNGTPYTMGLPTVLYDSPEEIEGYIRRDMVFHVDSQPFTLAWYEVEP